MITFALSLALKLVLSACMSAYLGLGALMGARRWPGLWAFKGSHGFSVARVRYRTFVSCQWGVPFGR